jgi:acyl dehydratase
VRLVPGCVRLMHARHTWRRCKAYTNNTSIASAALPVFCRAVFEERRTYLPQEVQLFLRLTGDSNLLHTDDAAAVRQGMSPRAS